MIIYSYLRYEEHSRIVLNEFNFCIVIIYNLVIPVRNQNKNVQYSLISNSVLRSKSLISIEILNLCFRKKNQRSSLIYCYLFSKTS